MSISTSSNPTPPVNRHALTTIEKQRAQLEKLFKDPAKPAYIPLPPKEKTIRPAREMMKNVQGSSAGAGSGEFHVYKASRRREYERLKLIEDAAEKEDMQIDFDQKRKEVEEQAEAKTAKNRAKRQKKKAKSKLKGGEDASGSGSAAGTQQLAAPLKKRRLVNGQELVFRQPGEQSDEEQQDKSPSPAPAIPISIQAAAVAGMADALAVTESSNIIIHDD